MLLTPLLYQQLPTRLRSESRGRRWDKSRPWAPPLPSQTLVVSLVTRGGWATPPRWLLLEVLVVPWVPQTTHESRWPTQPVVSSLQHSKHVWKAPGPHSADLRPQVIWASSAISHGASQDGDTGDSWKSKGWSGDRLVTKAPEAQRKGPTSHTRLLPTARLLSIRNASPHL